jgi:hypothetical protein
MLIANSLEKICASEEIRFRRTPTKKVRLIAILFCRPESSLMQSDVIPSLPYFHCRSGSNTAFYFAGFEDSQEYWEDVHATAEVVLEPAHRGWNASMEVHGRLTNRRGFFVTGPGETQWCFVPSRFNRFRADVQRRTRWRYSGGCDMILVNSRRGLGIDFTTALALRLDKISDLVATPTVSQLFEAIFQYTEKQDTSNPTWSLSDHLALKTAGSGLWDVMVGCLPEAVRASVKAARHLVARDIGL